MLQNWFILLSSFFTQVVAILKFKLNLANLREKVSVKDKNSCQAAA